MIQHLAVTIVIVTTTVKILLSFISKYQKQRQSQQEHFQPLEIHCNFLRYLFFRSFSSGAKSLTETQYNINDGCKHFRSWYWKPDNKFCFFSIQFSQNTEECLQNKNVSEWMFSINTVHIMFVIIIWIIVWNKNSYLLLRLCALLKYPNIF